MNSPGWSTRHLTEFLEAISTVGDVPSARRVALERVAEAVDAEIALFVGDRGIEQALGVDPEQVSQPALNAVREGRSKTIEVAGIGRCMALSIAIGGELSSSLVVARPGAGNFSGEELNAARGLAHALAMAERMLYKLDEERELRIEHEEQVRERHAAEANYRSLVERLPAIVYSAEPGESGRWTYVSPQIEKILGFTPEEWMADPTLWAQQIHPEDRDRAVAAESEAELTGPHPAPIDYRMLTKDGRVIWVLDEGVLEIQNGNPTLHGILYDITERKRAERELERRSAQQAAVSRLGERALRGATLEALMEDATAFVAAGDGVGQSCAWHFDREAGSLTLHASAGLGSRARELSVRVGRDSPAGLAIVSGHPVSVSDWEGEDRFRLPGYLRDLDVRSTIAVTIEGERQPLGALEAHSSRPDAFSADDMYFAQSAANVLAHAIERRDAGEALRHGSLHDHVTGLPNRPLLMDRVAHALGVAKGRETPLAVFFCDLDNFKLINDSLGHEVGDEVLKAVVPRIRRQLRSVDTVSRFGGDEFVILVEEVVDETEAIRIAERICTSFKEPFVVEDREQHLTTSIGVSISGDDGASPDALVRDAHAAVYRAKDRGRNRAELFDTEMRSRSLRRLQLERELRRALDREQLTLQYQPIVALGSGEIPTVEALLRWEHPERGTIDPSDFVPVAEDSGLIHPIGRWVIERACQQSLAWHHLRPDSRPIDVTVNLSPRQFADPDLPSIVAAILSRTGLDAAHMKFEITESVLVEKSGAADQMLRDLNGLGVQLILDDFGTGYSSLSYLNRFPFDAIKIDRSFIEGLGIEPERSAIVEAIIGMARALDMRTIAEGVENEVQLAELRRLGCGYAQGFLFSGSLRVPEMSALLQRAASGSPFSLVPPTAAGAEPGIGRRRRASPGSSQAEAPR